MATATKNGGDTLDLPPAPTLLAVGDPPDTTGTPLILNNAYFELTGVNLRCLVHHLELQAENKPVTVTTLCYEQDLPGVVKYHLKLTFQMSFDAGTVYDTLAAAVAAYQASSQPANFKVRPYANRLQAANNPVISGFVIPQPFDVIVGDAGTAAETQIDWILTGPWNVDKTGVVATGATSGAPGFFTPSGAGVPANLAALTGITASPTTAWATGQYVITADLLANHWSGTAWVTGKA
jgi:hypothetical protein